jgi:23S rRNA pseudouridine1911/1915/1917 synthase
MFSTTTVCILSKTFARQFLQHKKMSPTLATLHHNPFTSSSMQKQPHAAPTLVEIEEEMLRNQKKIERRTKAFFTCPACNSKVNDTKFYSHLTHCAPDLIPHHLRNKKKHTRARPDGVVVMAPRWPGSRAGAVIAQRLEDQYRAEVLDLSFGDRRRTLEQVADATGTSIFRVKRAIRQASRSIPLVVDPPGKVLDLDVLFEDQDIIVVNKPPFITHHPKHRWLGGTLLNSVLGWVETNGGDPTTVGPATRLDRDTSGVCVFAKTKAAASVVGQTLAAPIGLGPYGGSMKQYLTLTEPLSPPNSNSRMPADVAVGEEFVVRKSLAVGPQRKNAAPLVQVTEVFDGGKDAETRFELLEKSPQGHELLLCTLHTGRTHQIRVHLQSAGRSVLGDTTYGSILTEAEFGSTASDWEQGSLKSSDGAIGRQALHAWRLRFLHPRTMEEMEVTAPLPKDMNRAARKIMVNHPYVGDFLEEEEEAVGEEVAEVVEEVEEVGVVGVEEEQQEETEKQDLQKQMEV